jgi:hypothetical protein
VLRREVFRVFRGTTLGITQKNGCFLEGYYHNGKSLEIGHHAAEAPKKIMVITIMQRNNTEPTVLCYYAKKGRIFIKVRMVYHVKLIKIDENFFSITWSYYAIWIFNPAMVVLATLFLDLLAIFKKMRSAHVKSY